MPAESEQKLPVLPCACANLRRAARAVTRLYNHELRSDGIEITQFTILMALSTAGEIPQGKLGEVLTLDSTTLTRMLTLMSKRGWVRAKQGNDRRFRIFGLTPAGRARFERSLPDWNRAQERLRTALGEDSMGQLGPLLSRVTLASVNA